MKATAALIGVALGLGLPIWIFGFAVLALSFFDLF